MENYTLNASISVDFFTPLIEDAYEILYDFPLVVSRKGVTVNQTSLPTLPQGSYRINITEDCQDPLIKILKIQDEKERMTAYESVIDKIDHIRRPWVVFKMLEIARNL